MLIIDGHNLIPKVPGLSLEDLDDEMALVHLLQRYLRARGRGDIDVFFDKAPPGYSGERAFGAVRAHFVQAGRTADEAIRLYLNQLGKNGARAATVVSSDRMVQAEARSHGAKIRRSEEFAGELLVLGADSAPRKTARGPAPAAPADKPREGLSNREVDEFLDLFHVDPEHADDPIDPPMVRPSPKKKSTSQGRGRPKR